MSCAESERATELSNLAADAPHTCRGGSRNYLEEDDCFACRLAALVEEWSGDSPGGDPAAGVGSTVAGSGLLADRERTHGTFRDNSRVFSGFLAAAPLESYPPELRYAVAGIYVKLARMACGMGWFAGHAEDIEGYARLIHDAVAEKTQER